MPIKTVMVYLMDKSNMQKEPIGIITERRKSERDNNNAIGMLRLARKEFAKTEEEAKRISSEITFNVCRNSKVLFFAVPIE